MGRKGRRLSAVSTRARRFSIVPLFLVLWGVIGAASPTALQDIANAVSNDGARWATFLAKPPNCSHRDGFPETARGSDEERVVRKDKGDRVLIAANREPNETFKAGSIPGLQMASPRPSFVDGGSFIAAELWNDEPQVAASFHRKEDDRLAGVPSALADLVTNDGADVLATAYAPADPYHPPESPFDSLLQGDGRPGRFVPPIANGDHDWMKIPLPAAAFSEEEQKCLATAIYFEARGESIKGQAAVAQVILNRVRSPAYPNSICDVVYQNDEWFNRCQFSFACDSYRI